MKLSQFQQSKNTQTAWLLAVVLFFSGLSYSAPSYAREVRTKASTELVLSARKNSVKTFKWFSPSQRDEQPSDEFHHSIELCSALAEIQFKETNKTHQQFSSALMTSSFLNQHIASLAYVIA